MNEWREGRRKKSREDGSVVLCQPALSGDPLDQIYTSDPAAFISAQRRRWSHAAGGGYTMKNKLSSAKTGRDGQPARGEDRRAS